MSNFDIFHIFFLFGVDMRSETVYQRKLIHTLEEMFPECVVIKNDPSLNQGYPDLLILFGNSWAMLEVKRSENEPTQPNQIYYVNMFDQMSFAAIIYPENEEQVLDSLQSIFMS